MKILLTGATGLIGKELGKELVKKGHQVVAITRNKKKAQDSIPFPCEIFETDLTTKTLPQNLFKNIDGIIHLAGENIGDSRWSQSRKTAINESRVATTKNLLKNASPVKFFISANAIGYYGDRGDETLTEQSNSGQNFLAEVCRNWEQAAVPFKNTNMQNTRFVFLRIGIVLSQFGGALETLRRLFLLRMGSPVGTGKQWMSWIHIKDLVSVFMNALNDDKLSGPINAVAPNPVTNYEFSKILAETLGVLLLPSAPSFAIKAALGEMSTLVLSSQKVTSEVLPQSLFKYQRLRDALINLCDGYRNGDSLFYEELYLPYPKAKVFNFFSKAENLEKITPPLLNFKIIKQSTSNVQKGTLIDYRLKIHGFPVKWRTLIEEYVDGQYFIDVQLKGPYSKWHHTHSFFDLGEGTLMVDQVRYKLPMGFLGSLFGGKFVSSDINNIFQYRKTQIPKLLE